MKNNLLVLGTKNLNKSLQEIKEYLDFSLVFFNKDNFTVNNLTNISAILAHNEALNINENLIFINNLIDKPVLLLEGESTYINSNFTEKMNFPLILSEFNIKIANLIISNKFIRNSLIKINDYIMDKNEKKLKKKKLFILLTEREIQLIELLHNEKKPLSKNDILKKVWKYSEGVDTHTVETHIYRLRKKIFHKFQDDNFITNSKNGYLI